MRIASWHIDGYGLLQDCDAELEDGLTIVLGPNEAGKTTLLDFIRGMLFGFTDRRRSRGAFHAPVHGGRHGGRIGLLDDDGGAWLIERYLGRQRLTVTTPDGSPGTAADLRRLLGGADGGLFRSIFAFGLAELAGIDSLEEDEVRELIFSAGLVGAGRSVSQAEQRLAKEQEGLVRLRQESATANVLRRRQHELESDLRRARRAAEGYYDLRAQVAELTAELAASSAGQRARHERIADLETLIHLHPFLVARARAVRLLAALPLRSDLEDRVLYRAPLIRQFGSELSGYEANLDQFESLTTSRVTVLHGLEAQLARLGGALCVEELAGVQLEEADLDELRGLVEVHLRTTERRDLHAGVVAEATTQLCAAEDELQRARERSGPLRSVATLEALERDVHELARLLRDRSARQRFAVDAARDAVLERLVTPPADRSRLSRSARLAGGGLACVGILVAILGIAISERGVTTLGIVVAALGLLLVLGGIALIVAARPQPARLHRSTTRGSPTGTGPIGTGPIGTGPSGHDLAGRERRGIERGADRAIELSASTRDEWSEKDQSRLDRRIGLLGSGLGLPDLPTAGEIESCEETIRAELGRATEIARLEVERDRAARALGIEQATGEALERSLAAAQSAIDAFLVAHGLHGVGHLGRVDTTVEAVRRAREYWLEITSIDAALERIAGSLRYLEAAVVDLEEELRPPGISAPDPTDRSDPTRDRRDGEPHDRFQTIRRVTELTALLDSAEEAERARRAVEEQLRAAELALSDALSAGARATRLADELGSGALEDWRIELDDLVRRRTTSEGEHEAIVRAHQAGLEALSALEVSADVAAIELELAAVSEELRQAVRRFTELGVARALLDRTLARYQSEHQPRVIARAAELFCEVTRGRYERLVPREAGDGSLRDRGIDLLTASGQRLDAAELSRGTLEQLYLCLRLGLAESFAERAATLPIVLDDVLVNFDPERAELVADVIATTARSHQVLLFTCHPHLAELAKLHAPRAGVLELARYGGRR